MIHLNFKCQTNMADDFPTLFYRIQKHTQTKYVHVVSIFFLQLLEMRLFLQYRV